MSEPDFDMPEPWGEDGQFYIAAGHIDLAEAFARFDKNHHDMCGEALAEYGIGPSDIRHGYATQAVYDTHGYLAEEWWYWHAKPIDGSVAITLLDFEGGSAFPDFPDLSADTPFGPDVPPPPPEDPTFGGRLVMHNGFPIPRTDRSEP